MICECVIPSFVLSFGEASRLGSKVSGSTPQPRDHGQIRWSEAELAESGHGLPTKSAVLMRGGLGAATGEAAAKGEEEDAAPLISVWHGRASSGDLHAAAKFLGQLSMQRSHGTLTFLDLAAGELPEAGEPFSLGSLSNEAASIMLDDGTNNWRGRFRGGGGDAHAWLIKVP